MEYYLITFENTHSAMATQKFLKDKLIFHTIPTLREISASCGISLKISSDYIDIIKEQFKFIPLDRAMYHVYHITESQISEISL